MIGDTYDCGEYGYLTQAQIAHYAGVSREAIRLRVNRGWTGPELLRPGHHAPIRAPLAMHVIPLWAVCEPGPPMHTIRPIIQTQITDHN